MLDSFQTSIARKMLAEWEGLFKKYSVGHGAWPDVYKEYFLVKQMRGVSGLLYRHLCELSHEYPVTYHYFCSVQKSIEAGCSVYAPEGVQRVLYELSRLSQQIRLYNLPKDKRAYTKLAGTLNCSSKVLRYYKEAESAHKLFAEYLQNVNDDSMVAIGADLLTGVGSDPASGKNDLIKFQKLDFPIECSEIKSIEHLIEQGESQTLEFKAAFIPNTKRKFDKKNIEIRRIEKKRW